MVKAVIELPEDLYRTLSIGKSAELAGLPIWDFIEILGKNGVDVINYDEEQMNIELESVGKLKKVYESERK